MKITCWLCKEENKVREFSSLMVDRDMAIKDISEHFFKHLDKKHNKEANECRQAIRKLMIYSTWYMLMDSFAEWDEKEETVFQETMEIHEKEILTLLDMYNEEYEDEDEEDDDLEEDEELESDDEPTILDPEIDKDKNVLVAVEVLEPKNGSDEV